MLVLTRSKDESIMIGDGVIITVVDIRGDKVRLGIDAPKETVILRREIYESIRRENLDAQRQRPEDLGDLNNLI